MKMKLRLLVLLGLISCSVGCINPLPSSVGATQSEPEALALLAESAAAHGGDERFQRVSQVEVSYGDAEWLGRVWVFQPILVDRGFRMSSVETIRYNDAWPSTMQVHQGSEGEKLVRWPVPENLSPPFERPVEGGAAVLYNGRPSTDQGNRALQEQASAMVVEAYRMFLTAPFYFTQRAGRGNAGSGSMIAVMSSPDEVDGVDCDQVLIELRPGFGVSEVDRVQVAIAKETALVHRVRFSLDGFSGTRGATADVIRSGFVEVGGLILPTQFLEVVTHPLNRPVHQWRARSITIELDEPDEWTAAKP